MSIASRTVPPEALIEARRLYEMTTVPIQAIADLLGISRSTLNKHIPGWGWTRRRDRIPKAPMPPAVAEPAASAPEPSTRRDLVARLIARIESEIAAVERLVARAGLHAGADGADTERAARTLGLLVRTLRELAAIERHAAEPLSEEEAVRDSDTYRRELADTLERLLASRAAG